MLLRLKIGAKTPRVDQPLVGGASFFTFYYLPGLAIVEMVVLNSKSQGGVPIVPGGEIMAQLDWAQYWHDS